MIENVLPFLFPPDFVRSHFNEAYSDGNNNDEDYDNNNDVVDVDYNAAEEDVDNDDGDDVEDK